MFQVSYTGENTINLISSIQGMCGKESLYAELKQLPVKQLESSEVVIVFLIDALGYKWLTTYGRESFLCQHLVGSMSSVYPSTTSVAVTAFSTGKTASDHGIVSWSMYSQELDDLIQILPRRKKLTREGLECRVEDLTCARNFYAQSERTISVVTMNAIKDSPYNTHFNQDARVLGYDNLSECIDQIITASKDPDRKKKYIYGYRGEFDAICHDFGITSKEAKEHFQVIDLECQRLFHSLQDTDTKIIITADHGQLDCFDHVDLKKDYPDIYALLERPLAGEQRTQFCFVKKGSETEFYNKVKNELHALCSIFTKEEVREKQLFGAGSNKQFLQRIGDFVLLVKEGYTLIDGFDKPMIGNHGGCSDREVLVPLIVLE